MKILIDSDKMVENIPTPQGSPECDEFVQPERRKSFDRRRYNDRRSQEERRFDSRVAPVKPYKTIRTWLRSLTHLRLGVDRRKQRDRRKNEDRRNQRQGSILTREELADLLS